MKINETFKALIPDLSKEEYKQLENNCLEEGIREKILTWNGFIIDGHNRYAIATQWNLEYQTEAKHFNNEVDVRIWMRNNQKGRRNLTKAWMIELELGNKADLALKGENKYKETVGRPSKESLSLNDNNKPKHNTRNEIAKAAGTSTGMVAMSEVVKDKNPDLWEKAKSGEVTVTGAYNEIKKEERKLKQIEVEKSKKAIPIPVDLYEVIYCDPPWRYDFAESNSRAIENQYPTMDIEDIKNMDIPSTDDCILVMWATAPKLPEALAVIEAWGFEYKTCAVWDKEIIGMGYWFRGQHEMLMIATKGKVSPPITDNRFPSMYKEKRTKHSKKPMFYYDMIKKMFPDKKKIELFSRTEVEGFDNWGNE